MDNKAWKPIKYERKIWETSYSDTQLYSQQIKWLAAHKEYDAAIPNFISKNEVELSKAEQKLINETFHLIGKFEVMMSQKSLTLPLILLRSESSCSSQIEHLTTSAKKVALAQLEAKSTTDAIMVVNNINAMTSALAQADMLSIKSILNIHKILLQNEKNMEPGKIRSKQVWIGGCNLWPSGALFVPPVCSRVEELLKDLITFSKREDVDAISKAAIIHAQFETIHPFLDGNGRVGRTILHTILKHEGALTNSAIPISAGLLNNLDKYFKSLNDYRSGNYSSIINDFCIAIQNGILIADIMVKKIEETLMNWKNKIKARSDSNIWKAIYVLVEQPVINANFLAKKLNIHIDNAYKIIDILISTGILKEISGGKRNTFYLANEITNILDEVASISSIRRIIQK